MSGSGDGVYCDWRFQVYDCESSSFFYGVAVFQASCLTFQIFLCLCLFGMRLYNRLGSERLLRFGDDGMQASLVSCLLVWLIQISLVLGRAELASEIVWAFMIPFSFFPVVFFVATILQGFPHIFLNPHKTALNSLVESSRLRRILLTTFFSFMILLNIAIYAGAWAKEREGNAELAARLTQAALTTNAACILILGAFLLYVLMPFLAVLRSLRQSTREFHEMDHSDQEDEHKANAEDALKKIKSRLVSFAVNGTFVLCYELLLAFYGDFFTNLPFTRAMNVIFIGIIPSTSLLLLIFSCLLEAKNIRRKLHSSSARVSSARNSGYHPDTTKKTTDHSP